MTDYDPVLYWNNRADPNAARGREKTRVAYDANYIRQQSAGAASVFELGAGVGRTLAAYAAGTHITTLDISRLYQDQLAEVAKKHSLKLNQYFLDDPLGNFPFDDDSFDCGVSFQVFIHQPPEIFHHCLAEMLRICQKVIVNVGVHRNSARLFPPQDVHVFAHDYIHAVSGLDGIIHDMLMKDGRLYFTAQKDRG